jgi:hypothetical protein
MTEEQKGNEEKSCCDTKAGCCCCGGRGRFVRCLLLGLLLVGLVGAGFGLFHAGK